ncbi:hypothetical protein [Achromobacter sp. PAB15]|uniref:hypothetical protein n=1 Tax=Achromobacter sp. PAB15 TaxID=3233048 RepID=UPI003F933B33
MTSIRKLIRVDGTETELIGPHALCDVAQMIGASYVGAIRLADRVHVMLVDDEGHFKHLPVNDVATRLYHAVCVPGTTRPIVGDVVVVPDADYARAE